MPTNADGGRWTPCLSFTPIMCLVLCGPSSSGSWWLPRIPTPTNGSCHPESRLLAPLPFLLPQAKPGQAAPPRPHHHRGAGTTERVGALPEGCADQTTLKRSAAPSASLAVKQVKGQDRHPGGRAPVESDRKPIIGRGRSQSARRRYLPVARYNPARWTVSEMLVIGESSLAAGWLWEARPDQAVNIRQRPRASNRTIKPLRPLSGAIMFLMAVQGGLLWAQSDADEQAVRQVLADRELAWNTRDASAWVKDFAADSRFINILGMRFPDRATNERRHAALFATIFRNSSLSVDVLEIRFADPDTAIVEARLRLTGYEALPPGIRESAPGTLETRLVDVLQWIDGRWLVIFSQNTAIAVQAMSADCSDTGTEHPDKLDPSDPAHPPVKRYEVCADMRAAGWTRRVNRDGGTCSDSWDAAERKTYSLNQSRDRDGDGHACE